MKHSKTLRVVLLAYPGMNLIDLSGPLQSFVTAGRIGPAAGVGEPRPLYEVRVLSAQGGALLTGAGLTVTTEPLEALDGQAIDTLIAPGGSVGEAFEADPALVAWIGKNAARARRVCSVCTGAFLLAAAGLLDGKRVTTHWDWALRLQQQYPAIEVDPEPIFIREGDIWTSAGVTAGIDLALALIEQDYGHKVAIATARQLVMFIKRPGGQSQFSVPLVSQSSENARFAELHAWIAGNLKNDLRVENLASRVNMSPRTFARTYVAEQGRTPAKTVEAMRLEAACRALEETDLPLKSIATETGHGEEQNLRRVFQRQLGVSPAQYRSRFSAH
ncbi:GlxA family transcriptional regulator [Herbaspirillum sp. RV1423]|uniref:GlxA family transcriptional regulator n=1 Tax=Herbaspirillum sp. RV1423 TaxID=1443993 RepID=UPI0004B36051|nr:DJ-1/PfpI family protein [Herbaspirillum sp. RV1423]